MKTVQDLVNELNENYPEQGKYIISHENNTGVFIIGCIRNDIRHDLVAMSSSDHEWSLWASIAYQVSEVQHAIIDYLANSNPEDWFAEKKYNIIIGKDNCSPHYSAYRKMGKGEYIVRSTADEDELKSFEYLQFTESEIEQLKSTLEGNMQKIVDLGKTEVEG